MFVQSGYKEVFGSIERSRVEFPEASLPGDKAGSRGTELSWQLQNKYKDGVRRCKEGFMCDLKC
jgi:hypothetical protein